VIDVSGGVESTVHVRLAGVASVFPTGSLARTSKVCEPWPRPETERGDEHAAQAPASRRHSNPAPASEAVNSNVADVACVTPDGPAVRVVAGGVASTVQLRAGG
jgi:hypothetical protein